MHEYFCYCAITPFASFKSFFLMIFILPHALAVIRYTQPQEATKSVFLHQGIITLFFCFFSHSANQLTGEGRPQNHIYIVAAITIPLVLANKIPSIGWKPSQSPKVGLQKHQIKEESQLPTQWSQVGPTLIGVQSHVEQTQIHQNIYISLYLLIKFRK